MQNQNKVLDLIQQNDKDMTTQLSQMTKEELGSFLAPLTDLACQMILAGTLKKNVVRHFTNKGIGLEAATNLMDCGVIKAENFMANKAR